MGTVMKDGTYGLKTKTKIIELHLSPEKIAEVTHIIDTEHRTKRNDKIREALGGSNLCLVCGAIPAYKLSHDMNGVTRNQSYCKKCFETRPPDMNNKDLARLYGCVKKEI